MDRKLQNQTRSDFGYAKGVEMSGNLLKEETKVSHEELQRDDEFNYIDR